MQHGREETPLFATLGFIRIMNMDTLNVNLRRTLILPGIRQLFDAHRNSLHRGPAETTAGSHRSKGAVRSECTPIHREDGAMRSNQRSPLPWQLTLNKLVTGQPKLLHVSVAQGLDEIYTAASADHPVHTNVLSSQSFPGRHRLKILIAIGLPVTTAAATIRHNG